MDRQTFSTRIILKRPDDLCEKVTSESLPYLLAIVCAAMPAITRYALGKDPIPFIDRDSPKLNDSLGTERLTRFVALFYMTSVLILASVLLKKVGDWLSLASKALFKYKHISQLPSPLSSLSFYMPIITPDNLEGWLRMRRQLYLNISDELNEIFRVNLLIAPFIVITLALAVGIFFNVVVGNAQAIFNFVGFYLLVVLSFYVVVILYITAVINENMNDEVVKALSAQKYTVSTEQWQDAKLQKSSEAGWKDHGSLDVGVLCTMEMMIDSANQRIKDQRDEGLYISVFGIPITMGFLFAVASALITSITAAVARFVLDEE